MTGPVIAYFTVGCDTVPGGLEMGRLETIFKTDSTHSS